MLINIKDKLNQKDILEILKESVYMPTMDKLHDRANRYQSKDNIIAYGLQVGGKLCGVIVVDTKDPKHLIICDIAVLRTYWRQGCGTKLIHEMKEILQPEEIIAETDNDAVEFYRKIGFHIEDLGEKYAGIQRYECRLVC